jgi:hypothetical protein
MRKDVVYLFDIKNDGCLESAVSKKPHTIATSCHRTSEGQESCRCLCAFFVRRFSNVWVYARTPSRPQQAHYPSCMRTHSRVQSSRAVATVALTQFTQLAISVFSDYFYLKN